MDKCDSCLAKSFFETVFDLHWFGEDDCPFDECAVDKIEKAENEKENDT